ncbi:MAG: type II secretion system F family protein [Chloroflexota bacterium]
MNLLVFAGIFGVVAIGTMMVGFILSRQESELTQRLDSVTRDTALVAEPKKRREKKQEERALSRFAESMDKALSRRGVGSRVSDRLAQANVRLTVTEYIIINILSVVGALFGGYLIFQTWVLAVFVGVFGYFLPRMYLGFAKNRRLHRFNDQLGDCINLLVNGLRSGYSMLQAMETVAKELPAPISEEFARVVQEVGLGLSSEQSLNNMWRRIQSDDLDLMITAVNVQHEVGGNLAEILDIISFTIRERVRIKGEIRTLTAQGMLSGYVISFLPIGLGLIMFLMNREYMTRMFTTTCGWIMVGVALFGIVVGFIAIQKIVRIEV